VFIFHTATQEDPLDTQNDFTTESQNNNNHGHKQRLQDKLKAKQGKRNLDGIKEHHKLKKKGLRNHKHHDSLNSGEILPINPIVQDTTPFSTIKTGPHPPSSRIKV